MSLQNDVRTQFDRNLLADNVSDSREYWALKIEEEFILLEGERRGGIKKRKVKLELQGAFDVDV